MAQHETFVAGPGEGLVPLVALPSAADPSPPAGALPDGAGALPDGVMAGACVGGGVGAGGQNMPSVGATSSTATAFFPEVVEDQKNPAFSALSPSFVVVQPAQKNPNRTPESPFFLSFILPSGTHTPPEGTFAPLATALQMLSPDL